MKRGVCFDDVLLEPLYSDIRSRKEVSLDSKINLNGKEETLSLPVFSAPMDKVTEDVMAVMLGKCGGFGIIHRYNSIEEQCELVKNASHHGFVGAAVGVTDDFLERTSALVDSGVSMICLDVAHGHHVMVKEALTKIKSRFSNLHVMAGNIATLEAFNDLADWGADSVRCGIGGGSICTTRIQTGHGKPTLQTVIDCAQSDRDALLVADGGIKTSGDIVKCLAAGADMVMLGSMLAGTDESPGEIINENNRKCKVYRGMASKEAQFDWRGRTASLEGVATVIPYKGTVLDVLEDLEKGIRSGLSYSGCRSLEEFRNKAIFTKQTTAGQIESSAHIGAVK